MTVIRIGLRWAGASLSEVAEPYRMLEEPHRLIIQVGDRHAVGRQCACADCIRDLGEAEDATGPEELAQILASFTPAGEPPPELEVVLMDEMVEPLADGSTTHALAYARSLATAAATFGISSHLVVPARPVPYPEGTWLRAVGDSGACGLQHLLVEGMIGQVVPKGWVTCTPGISVMTRIEGRAEGAGHDWSCLVPMDAPPTADELTRARQVCANAADLFQARNGWCGGVSIGSTVMAENKARAEILKLIEKLPALWQAGRTTDYAGNGKRLVKLLRGFAVHPQGAELAAAATSIGASLHEAPPQVVLDEVTAWLAAHPAAGAGQSS